MKQSHSVLARLLTISVVLCLLLGVLCVPASAAEAPKLIYFRGMAGTVHMRASDNPSGAIDTGTEDFDLMGSYAAAPGGTFTVGNLYRTGTSARFSAKNDKLVFDFILPEMAGCTNSIDLSGKVTPTLIFRAWNKTAIVDASSVSLVVRYEEGTEHVVTTGTKSLDFGTKSSYLLYNTWQCSVAEQVYIRVEISAGEIPNLSNPGAGGGTFTCSFDFGSSSFMVHSRVNKTPYVFIRSIESYVSEITNSLFPNLSSKLDLIFEGIKAQDNNVKASVDKVNDTLTSTPDENATASGFKDDMKEQSESIGGMVQEIEQKQNRPAVADVVPVVNTGVINPTDTAAADGKELVADMLNTPLLLQMLTIVFSLAFLRYVIFGKSEG